jgi:hypothetical protein
MQAARITLVCAGLILGACAAKDPPATADSRWPFDTVRGMYGGNEFQARSPEGKITYEGDPKDAASAQSSPKAQAPAAAPAPTTPAPATPAPVALAAAGAPPPSADAAQRIAIDSNAFAAVFPGAGGAVHPSAEQLMQLDALSMVAAEPTRTKLQQQILACRRAQSGCLLTAP